AVQPRKISSEGLMLRYILQSVWGATVSNRPNKVSRCQIRLRSRSSGGDIAPLQMNGSSEASICRKMEGMKCRYS
ncbi:MAG: hypothetical protein WA434_02255, partial [Candidatus Acidiferrales bacterium]